MHYPTPGLMSSEKRWSRSLARSNKVIDDRSEDKAQQTCSDNRCYSAATWSSWILGTWVPQKSEISKENSSRCPSEPVTNLGRDGRRDEVEYVMSAEQDCRVRLSFSTVQEGSLGQLRPMRAQRRELDASGRRGRQKLYTSVPALQSQTSVLHKRL
jgi:hypothetical protein